MSVGVSLGLSFREAPIFLPIRRGKNGRLIVMELLYKLSRRLLKKSNNRFLASSFGFAQDKPHRASAVRTARNDKSKRGRLKS